MATATAPAPAPSPGVNLFWPVRLLTAADLAALPTDLPSGPVRYELDNGRLLIMAPPGDAHSGPQLSAASLLYVHGQQAGHGRAYVEVGIVLWRNPDRVVGADAAFVTNASLPVKRAKEGYLETIPELVVEVRSKNDSIPEIEAKVADYHRAGVQMVWVLDPDKRTLTLYPNGGPEQTLDAAATLDASPFIPGLRVPVRDLFD